MTKGETVMTKELKRMTHGGKVSSFGICSFFCHLDLEISHSDWGFEQPRNEEMKTEDRRVVEPGENF